MRAVIQRVKKASVSINDEITGSIHQGLLVLLGIEETDNETDIEWLSGKITRLRIFDDANGVMNCSVCEIGGEALVISQFTLHASTKKGNRPSYICHLYTSDAADDLLCVDLGGRRIIKKKNQ